jgi:hypothetical protein
MVPSIKICNDLVERRCSASAKCRDSSRAHGSSARVNRSAILSAFETTLGHISKWRLELGVHHEPGSEISIREPLSGWRPIGPVQLGIPSAT